MLFFSYIISVTSEAYLTMNLMYSNTNKKAFNVLIVQLEQPIVIAKVGNYLVIGSELRVYIL